MHVGGRIRAQQTILIMLLATRGRAVWSLSLSRGSPSQPFHSGYDACSIRRKLKLEPLRGQGQDQKAALLGAWQVQVLVSAFSASQEAVGASVCKAGPAHDAWQSFHEFRRDSVLQTAMHPEVLLASSSSAGWSVSGAFPEAVSSCMIIAACLTSGGAGP